MLTHRTRQFLASVAVVATTLVAGVPAASAATAAKGTAIIVPPAPPVLAPDQVKPFLVCTWIGEGQFVSVFGYSAAATGSMPVGTDNNFSPIGANQGQPTSFVQGTDNHAVVVTHTNAITWHLGAGDATAPVDNQPCKSDPMPMTGHPLALVVWITAGFAIAGIVVLVKRRRARNSFA